jgi:hypothetical protein
MVGHLTLNQAVGVRVPAPQPSESPFESDEPAGLSAGSSLC